MPNVRAPLPPVLTLLSYPIIPPSIIMPANNSGPSFCTSSPVALATSSLPERIICRSLTRESIPCLSATLNQVPPPAVLSASINNSVPP